RRRKDVIAAITAENLELKKGLAGSRITGRCRRRCSSGSTRTSPRRVSGVAGRGRRRWGGWGVRGGAIYAGWRGGGGGGAGRWGEEGGTRAVPVEPVKPVPPYEALAEAKQAVLDDARRHPELRHREMAWRMVDEDVV